LIKFIYEEQNYYIRLEVQLLFIPKYLPLIHEFGIGVNATMARNKMYEIKPFITFLI